MLLFSLVNGQGDDWNSDTFTGGICTTDVLSCPDGSYVSRDSSNNCEFDDCPCDGILDVSCWIANAQNSVFSLFDGDLEDVMLDPTSVTDFLWDNLPWEEATESMSDILLFNWMDAIDLDTELEAIETAFEDLASNFDFNGMNQTEIFDTIQDSTQWESLVTSMGWDNALDFGSFAANLNEIVNDLKISDMDLGFLTDAVDALGTELSVFGFEDLLSLADYELDVETAWQTLQDGVDTVNQQVTDAVDQLLNDWTLYENGDGTSVTVATLLEDVRSVEDAVNAVIDAGGNYISNYEAFETVLETVDWGLTQFNQFSGETELLVDLASSLEVVLNAANYIPDSAISSIFSTSWLDTFIGSLQDIINVDENQAPDCDTDYVDNLVFENVWEDPDANWLGAIAIETEYRTTCFELGDLTDWASGNGLVFTPDDCDCWQDLWSSSENAIVVNGQVTDALKCTLEDDPTRTAEYRIAECNGVILDTGDADEISLLDTALNGLKSLASSLVDFDSLLDDWSPIDLVGDAFDLNDLMGTIDDITNGVDTLGILDISGDSISDWTSAITEWGVDFDDILSSIDALDSLTGSSFSISDFASAVDTAMGLIGVDNDVPTPRPTVDPGQNNNNTDDGSSFPTWAWVVVGGFLVLMVVLAFYQCTKQKKIANGVAIEGESWPIDEELPEAGINLDDGERDQMNAGSPSVRTTAVRPVVNGTQVTSGEPDII